MPKAFHFTAWSSSSGENRRAPRPALLEAIKRANGKPELDVYYEVEEAALDGNQFVRVEHHDEVLRTPVPLIRVTCVNTESEPYYQLTDHTKRPLGQGETRVVRIILEKAGYDDELIDTLLTDARERAALRRQQMPQSY